MKSVERSSHQCAEGIQWGRVAGIARRGLRWMAVALISVVIGAGSGVVGASAGAPTHVLSLPSALERALEHHPRIKEELDREESTLLSYDQQSARYRMTARASTSAGAQWSFSDPDDGLTTRLPGREGPINVHVDWQLPSGPTVSAQVRLQDEMQLGNESLLSLSASWNVWPGPRADDQAYQWRVAGEALDDAPLLMREAQISALVDTYRRYRQLQIDQANLAVIEAELIRLDTAWEQAVKRADRGIASAADVTLARLDYEQAESNRARSEAQYRRTLAHFSRELGLDQGTIDVQPLDMETDLPAPIPWTLTLDEAMDEAIAVSASRRNTVRQLEAASRKRQLAEADTGWSASLSTGTALNRSGTPPVVTAMLNVGYDLADGGSRDISRIQAQREERQAEEALTAFDAQLRDDIERRLIDVQWAWDQLMWAHQAYEAAGAAYAVKEEQAALGIIRADDVDDSKLAWERAFLDYVKAYVDYESARLELAGLCGLPIHVENYVSFDI